MLPAGGEQHPEHHDVCRRDGRDQAGPVAQPGAEAAPRPVAADRPEPQELEADQSHGSRETAVLGPDVGTELELGPAVGGLPMEVRGPQRDGDQSGRPEPRTREVPPEPR